MGLWSWITNGIQKNLQRRDAGSSQEYQNAFNAANQSIGQTQQLADQYTGNQGYQNSLQQATQGARNAGMSKAQAAAMGNQTANNVYANAFQNQQQNAMGMGQNAISAQQGITGAQQGQASQAQGEKQNVYNRATQNSPLNKIGSIVQTLV